MYESMYTPSINLISVADVDWTTAEVAIAMGKSKRTIQRMIQNGELEGYKIDGANGHSWRVKSLSVLKAIELNNLLVEQLEKSKSKSSVDALIDILYEKIDKLERQQARSEVCNCHVKAMPTDAAEYAKDEVDLSSSGESNRDDLFNLESAQICDNLSALEQKYPHLNWWSKLLANVQLHISLLRLSDRSEKMA